MKRPPSGNNPTAVYDESQRERREPYGTISSVFVAAAIALYLGVTREDLVRPVKKDEVEEMVPYGSRLSL